MNLRATVYLNLNQVTLFCTEEFYDQFVQIQKRYVKQSKLILPVSKAVLNLLELGMCFLTDTSNLTGSSTVSVDFCFIFAF